MTESNEKWWRETLDYAARTDVGMRRRNNQDSYADLPAASPRLWRSRGHVFLVADGMGAHAAGELASKIASQVAPQSYLNRSAERPSEALRNAIMEAHETIRKRGDSDPSFRDMGTTCDVLVLAKEGAYVGHVGDSRVYRARDHVIEQLTFDHSLVWEIRYIPTSHSAYRQLEHIPKNVITRSLGPTDNLVVDIEGPFETKPRDVFLMCSDGLSGQVEDEELGQIMELLSPRDAAEALVNLANLRGGPDNITVVVARVKGIPNDEDVDRASAKADRYYAKRPPLTVSAWCAFSFAIIFACAALASFLFRFDAHVAAGVATTVAACLSTTLAFVFGRKTFFRHEDAPQGKLGDGPYVRKSAAPSETFADNLAALCGKLLENVKTDPRYMPDWNGIDAALAQANAAREQKNCAVAIRGYLGVVNYIMREVRKFANAQNSKRHAVEQQGADAAPR